MIFDRDGNLVLAGADQPINGKPLNPNYLHSGGVDWDGNVYIIQRDAHRIVKLSPKLDKFLLQIGTHSPTRRATTRRTSTCRRASRFFATGTSPSPTATATTV